MFFFCTYFFQEHAKIKRIVFRFFYQLISLSSFCTIISQGCPSTFSWINRIGPTDSFTRLTKNNGLLIRNIFSHTYVCVSTETLNEVIPRVIPWCVLSAHTFGQPLLRESNGVFASPLLAANEVIYPEVCRYTASNSSAVACGKCFIWKIDDTPAHLQSSLRVISFDDDPVEYITAESLVNIAQKLTNRNDKTCTIKQICTRQREIPLNRDRKTAVVNHSRVSIML